MRSIGPALVLAATLAALPAAAAGQGDKPAEAGKAIEASATVATAKPAKPKARRAADPVVTGSIGPIPEPVPFRPPYGLVSWYQERGGMSLPSGDRLVYCHGFECRLRTAIPMSGEDLKTLTELFASHAATPEAEREAIDLAVQWWEKHAAPLLGGPPDIRGSEPKHANKRGQTDCLDEATNSTTILVYLQEKGLLRHHRVIRPESRGGFLYAHATAVFQEVAGGRDWIVDSWMRDSGDPNDVMPLDQWLASW
ncbi:hypothetical protein [Prosthecomicrobium sp. N25]|uniref:hypothetical protein n=1 Tax=Prosthecomicrobium sp. N25 TaxID=3129254 RepID=UPI003077A133